MPDKLEITGEPPVCPRTIKTHRGCTPCNRPLTFKMITQSVTTYHNTFATFEARCQKHGVVGYLTGTRVTPEQNFRPEGRMRAGIAHGEGEL